MSKSNVIEIIQNFKTIAILLEPLNCIILSVLKIEAVCLHTLVELSQQRSQWGQIIFRVEFKFLSECISSIVQLLNAPWISYEIAKLLKNLQTLLQFSSHISWLIMQKNNNSPLLLYWEFDFWCTILFYFILTAVINNSFWHFLFY